MNNSDKVILVDKNAYGNIGNEPYIFIANGYNVMPIDLLATNYLTKVYDRINHPHAVYICSNPSSFIDFIKFYRSIRFLYEIDCLIVYKRGVKIPKLIEDYVSKIMCMYEYDYKSTIDNESVMVKYEHYDEAFLVLKYDERGCLGSIREALKISNGIIFTVPSNSNIISNKSMEIANLFNETINKCTTKIPYKVYKFLYTVKEDKEEISSENKELKPYLIYRKPGDEDFEDPELLTLIYATNLKDVQVYLDHFLLTGKRKPDPSITFGGWPDYYVEEVPHSALIQKDFDITTRLV